MTENPSQKVELANYKIKVFLVDDQKIVGETVRRMLEAESDIEFHFCEDPTKAITTAAEIMPTVILQDLVMPDIEGMTLVKFYRAHKQLKDVPIIVLSSKEEAITKADAFAAGANDYLVKLPDKIELIARIRYHSKGYINLLERNDAYDALVKSQKELAAELAKAGEYCISLLPKTMEDENVKTDWRFIPSEQLGGDSFGYHWIDEDHFAMYLLDVCGHGVGSALLSVTALHALRSQTLPNVDFKNPDEVVSAMNEAFQMSDHNDLYFTMWYGVFNRQTREISYISAGHPPSLLINSNGDVQQLMNDNFIVGGMPGFPFKSTKAVVDENSKLFIYSDGVYEIEFDDGKMWEMDDYIDFMKDKAGNSETEIDTLHEYVMKMNGEEILDDDFSMLKVILK